MEGEQADCGVPEGEILPLKRVLIEDYHWALPTSDGFPFLAPFYASSEPLRDEGFGRELSESERVSDQRESQEEMKAREKSVMLGCDVGTCHS